MASERELADVAERRRIWINERQPLKRLETARLVFMDEAAVATNLIRMRARSRRDKHFCRRGAIRTMAYRDLHRRAAVPPPNRPMGSRRPNPSGGFGQPSPIYSNQSNAGTFSRR